MGKDPDNERGVLDGGDDLEPAAAVWTALNVNSKTPLSRRAQLIGAGADSPGAAARSAAGGRM